MGILDEINNMKNQGMDEREIVTQLQERGVTPKSIQEGFNQMRIKKAVSAESSGEEGMEPSIMNDDSKYGAGQPPSLYTPKTQEIEHDSEEFYNPQPPQQAQYTQRNQQYQIPPQQIQQQFNDELETPAYGENNQEEYTPQEGYEEQGAGNYDTNTLIEIAEQVFSEKIKKEQKQLEALNEFATLAEARISNDHERIKRIEEIIDKLQAAILEKVGSYGRNIDSIKNEMGMMQESFEKMVPSVHERNYNSGNINNRNEDQEENYGEPTGEVSQTESLLPSLINKKIPKTKKQLY